MLNMYCLPGCSPSCLARRNDEEQLGMSYKELEEAMDNPDSKNYQKYLKIRENNLHKMKEIPVCKFN